MKHYLPAVTLSTFMEIPKSAQSFPKQVRALVEAGKNIPSKVIHAPTLAESGPEKEKTFALGMRVVAVTLQNNTGKTVEIKKSLKIAVGDSVKEPIDFTPPFLAQKQATSVYLLYQLLQQRLPELNSTSPGPDFSASTPESSGKRVKSIFMASTGHRDFTTELKNLNIFNKILTPGQTVSGLIVFKAASAAPMQFFLN